MAKAQEDEEFERKEKQRVVEVLMDHGVSAAKGYVSVQHADQEVQNTRQTITSVKNMVREYDEELQEFRARIAVMEVAEVKRLQKEI